MRPTDLQSGFPQDRPARGSQAQRSQAEGGRPRGRAQRRTAQPVAALVGRALKDLGVPSARIGVAVEAAWVQAANVSWRRAARPVRLLGGVLEIAVDSAPLREELAQFHAARLLAVLRQALPDMTLLGLRFTPGGGEGTR